jgi:hypothetical protein
MYGLEVVCVLGDEHAAELGGALQDQRVRDAARADGEQRGDIEAPLRQGANEGKVQALV